MTLTQPFTAIEKLKFNQLITDYQNRRDEANDACTLFYTVTTGQLRLVEYWLNELTVQEQLASQIECTANARRTPLGIAVFNNTALIAALLLEYGADVSNRGELDYLPIYDAIKNNNSELIELLSIYGALDNLVVSDLPFDILSVDKDKGLVALIKADQSKKITSALLRFAIETRSLAAIQRILSLGGRAELAFNEGDLTVLSELLESVRANDTQQLNNKIIKLLNIEAE